MKRMVKRILIVFFVWCLTLPLSAQEHFISLDWSALPAATSLPEVLEEIALPADYETYSYAASLEFPELEALDAKSSSLLKSKNVTLPEIPKVETSISVGAHKGFLEIRFTPVVCRDGIYSKVLSYKINLIKKQAPQRVKASVAISDSSVLSTGKFVKIKVSSTGIYHITKDELAKMGFTKPENVRVYGYGGYVLSTKFAEHPADDLPEVPTRRVSDGLLFFARGPLSWKYTNGIYMREQNFYSEYGYYFLTEKDGSPAILSEEQSLTSENAPLTAFDAYSIYEKDAYSWSGTGRELYDGYDYSANNTQAYNFTLPNIVDAEGKVVVAFSSKSPSTSTSFTVSVDGTNLGTKGISSTNGAYYTKAVESVGTFNWTSTKKSSTVVSITHTRPSGISGRLNYLILNYQQKLKLDGAFLAFRSQASIKKVSTFAVSGANSATEIWDVTSPTNIRKIVGTLSGDTYSFTVKCDSLREFIAVNTASTAFQSVVSEGTVANQNLHGLRNIDMVVITPDKAGMIAQAERLAQAHRDADKMNITVVTAPQVYNEFSSGTPDATAYRRLMKMLYDRSAASTSTAPKYLLLFGDCSYDNRMISSAWKGYSPSDFLLCYQVASSVDETTSYFTDDYFGFLDNSEGTSLPSGRLDIGVGRFPVRTVDEATIAVDKTLAYMQNKNAGAWKRTVTFCADDAEGNDSSNGFMQHASDLADSLLFNTPGVRAERILEDAYKREASSTGYTYPQANKRLLQLFDEGMLALNYTGHSGTLNWSAENLLTSEQILKINSPRSPLWFTASCDFTRFDDLAYSGGEYAFLNPNGAAIALMSTSRVVYDDQNYELHKAFIHYLFKSNDAGERLRLGDIFRLSKCYTPRNSRGGTNTFLLTDDNKLNFNLTGDPALTLTYPDYKIVIDEFDGALSGKTPILKAGGKVTVKGHVLKPSGEIATGFNGILTPLVYDSKEKISTLNNASKGPVTYYAHDKLLFSGTDSVRSGKFEFVIPVPMDINYSDANGLLSLYARSSSLDEAIGSYDNFVVGGTDPNAKAIDDPQISLYLNTPDFIYGGQVNETPYFHADIVDKDGINSMGNGIGHDLSLCIDGKSTYSLNDYYTALSGSYTEGSVGYSIPTLTAGKHTLTFRAWDIMNRSTTKELEFEVVNGLSPDMFNVTCSKSPAKENTTFIISHNRPGSDLNVTITIYDYAGRELWKQTEEGVSSGNYYYVNWNLCSEKGQRLSPGIYLFKASISCDGSSECSKAQKIVILAQ